MAHAQVGIAVEGGEQPVTVVMPAGDQPVPYAVIVPSIFGIAPDLLEQMEELARDDAAVVAFEPFWRVEPGPIPYPEFQRAVDRLGPLDREQCLADWYATLDWVRAQPRCNGRVVVVGICFGAPFCLMAAADQRVDGVVTWHGSRMQNYLDRADAMTCPMMHHIGGDDRFVSAEVVEKVRAAFADRINVSIMVHPSADHGFSHRTGPAYNETAERAAVASVRDLLHAAT